MIAFPRLRCMFIYIYILVSFTRVCIVYVVKEVTSFWGGLGQLMGVPRNRTLAQALQSAADKKLLVALLAYVETGTNSWLFYLKYIPKVLQGPLKGKESR